MPLLKSWVPGADNSEHPLAHLPLGVRRRPDGSHAVVSRIGDQVADLRVLAEIGILDDLSLRREDFKADSLNALAGRGANIQRALRQRLTDVLREEPNYYTLSERREIFLLPADQVELVLPVQPGDYTDFYASREHATNVGTMFRDPKNALLPNWLHLPVGYHGRSSSITVSGTPVRRPWGQSKPAGEGEGPGFGPSKLLDFELELAAIVGAGNDLGSVVPLDRAEDHVFGVALFNDWSARDIQAWEYVPLGPFLGKSFASTLSAWITPLTALEPARREQVEQRNPSPLPYLRPPQGARHAFDIQLAVDLITSDGVRSTICESNTRHLYWTIAQQLTHHTVNGCNLRPGDVLASGTISGPQRSSYGSMLELSWRGTKPIQLEDGSQRKFVQDGDTIRLRAWVETPDLRFSLGEASAKVLAARRA